MKKLLSLLISILIIACSLSAFACGGKDPTGQVLTGSDLTSSTQKYVKWEGRYDVTEGDDLNPSKVNLYHTATGFTVDFIGTALYVDFDSTISGNSQNHYPYYNVAVDDEIIPTVNPDRTFHLSGGKETITVVSGLKYGRHTVKCLKMSEPYDAITSVYIMETDGEFIERDVDDDNAAYRFMVVCASGGSGHGSLGYSDDGKGSMGRNTLNSSSLHAFNYLTARIFNADVQFVANSGWGVSYPAGKSVYDVLDYSGITTSNNVSGAKTTALWDYNKWTPDVILFNIGGNDTTADGFKLATYKAEVVDMVKKLHQKYPNAYMVWTHTNSNAGNYAVQAMTDAGIMSAGYMKEVIIPKVGADGTVGANNHNSFYTHVTTADTIANAVAEWGFVKINENVKFEDYDSVLKKF